MPQNIAGVRETFDVGEKPNLFLGVSNNASVGPSMCLSGSGIRRSVTEMRTS